MSGRCQCCNRILLRPTGTRTLSDGMKVEETFCNVCRNEVNHDPERDLDRAVLHGGHRVLYHRLRPQRPADPGRRR